MKPNLVSWFDYLFWLGVLAALCGLYLTFDLIVGPNPDGAVIGGAIFGFALAVGVFALGWFFISRKGSKVAHWIFTGFSGAILVITFFVTLNTGVRFGLFAAGLEFARWAMWFLGSALLFLPEARPWFEKGAPTGPDTFD